MKVRLLFILLLMTPILLLPMIFNAMWLRNSGNQAVDSARVAIQTALNATSAGRRSVRGGQQVVSAANRSVIVATAGLKLAANSIQQLLRFLHSAELTTIHDVIVARVDAAEAVINSLVFAYNYTILDTCYPQSGISNTEQFMLRFLQKDLQFPGFFRYLWFMEPNPTSSASGQKSVSGWLQCGWTANVTAPLHAMNSNGTWNYWPADPVVSSQPLIPNKGSNRADVATLAFNQYMATGDRWNNVQLFTSVDDGASAKDPTMLLPYITPVFRNLSNPNQPTGFFGAALDLQFITAELVETGNDENCISFIIDTKSANIVAHTSQAAGQYTLDPITKKPLLYTTSTIPDIYIRMVVQFLLQQYLTLSAVPAASLDAEFDGVLFLVSTAPFSFSSMNWLVCQVHNRTYFLKDVYAPMPALAAAQVQSTVAFNEIEKLLNDVESAAQKMNGMAEGVENIGSDIRQAVTKSIVTVVCMTVGLLIMAALLYRVFVRPLQILSQEMEKVARMEIDTPPIIPSSFLAEVHVMAVSFRAMVAQLQEYKSYLPQGILRKDIADQPEPTSPTHGPNSPTGSSNVADSASGTDGAAGGVGGGNNADNAVQKIHASPSKGSNISDGLAGQGANAGGPHNRNNPLRRMSKIISRSNEFSRFVPSLIAPTWGSGTGANVTGASASAQPALTSGERLRIQHVTILCVNRRNTLQALETQPHAVFTAALADYVRMVLAHTQRAVPILFFGDQCLLMFTGAAHCVAAVRSAVSLQEAVNRDGVMQVSMGLAAGRALIGPMGCTGLKTFNAIGTAVGTSYALMRFCRNVEYPIVIDDEVYRRSHDSVQLFPVAMVSVRSGATPQPCYLPGDVNATGGNATGRSTAAAISSTAAAKVDNWMASDDLPQSANPTDSFQAEVMHAFNQWHQNHETPTNLNELKSQAVSHGAGAFAAMRFLAKTIEANAVGYAFDWHSPTTNGGGVSADATEDNSNSNPGARSQPSISQLTQKLDN